MNSQTEVSLTVKSDIENKQTNKYNRKARQRTENYLNKLYLKYLVLFLQNCNQLRWLQKTTDVRLKLTSNM